MFDVNERHKIQYERQKFWKGIGFCGKRNCCRNCCLPSFMILKTYSCVSFNEVKVENIVVFDGIFGLKQFVQDFALTKSQTERRFYRFYNCKKYSYLFIVQSFKIYEIAKNWLKKMTQLMEIKMEFVILGYLSKSIQHGIIWNIRTRVV